MCPRSRCWRWCSSSHMDRWRWRCPSTAARHYTPMETTLLQRLIPAEIRGQVFGARYSLVVAAAPLGAALGGVLLRSFSAPLVIAISGIACVLAGLGGLASPSLRSLRQGEG